MYEFSTKNIELQRRVFSTLIPTPIMKDSECFCCGLWTYEQQQQLDFKDTFEDSDVENCSISIFTCFCTIHPCKLFSE
jgi:hypothetical protein